jgi:hypothetical protein
MNEQSDQENQYQRLIGEGYTEDQIRMILSLGGLNAETGQLDKQQKYADKLRGTEIPEGRQVGNVYVAANPLEFIGAGMKQYAGKQQNDNLIQQQKQLQDEMMKRRLEYLKGGANPGLQQSTIPGTPMYGGGYEGQIA